jgi:hypothetical protein
MRQTAEAAGVVLDAVGAGGQTEFSRPDPTQAESGPIVEVLRDRFAGSSEEVNAANRGGIGDAGALAHGEADSAAADRQLPDAALLVNVAGTNPSAPRDSVLDATIAGEPAA